MNEQELQAALAAITKARETSEADYAAMQDAATLIYEVCDDLDLGVEFLIPFRDDRYFGIAYTDDECPSRRHWALGSYQKYEYNPGYRWCADFDCFNAAAMTDAFQLLSAFLEGWNKAIQRECTKREEAARIAKLAETAFSELLEKLKG
jgi:hypothetical protein